MTIDIIPFTEDIQRDCYRCEKCKCLITRDIDVNILITALKRHAQTYSKNYKIIISDKPLCIMTK